MTVSKRLVIAGHVTRTKLHDLICLNVYNHLERLWGGSNLFVRTKSIISFCYWFSFWKL